MKKALKTAPRGTAFYYAGQRWVVLEHNATGTLCLTEKIVEDRAFDDGNCNDFSKSSSLRYLNGPFLDTLIDAAGCSSAFLTSELDLTADDGLKDYGTCTVTNFLLTVDQYRRNRDVIPNADDWWWLSTAVSTASNGYEHSARYVYTDGTLYGDDAFYGNGGLRPAGLRIAGKMDTFIKLPEGETLPENIVSLTGITDALLQTEGVQPAKAASQIAKLMQPGPVLMIAHNAQFDACFLRGLLRGAKVGRIDWLDSLTVYKDRRPYPHKLANAILAYELEDKVQNSHRAIDDVLALFEVLKAMDDERDDLAAYVNLFGYNPKYGVSGRRIVGVRYEPQGFNKAMTRPEQTLPARVARR